MRNELQAGVSQVYATRNAFAVVKSDGSVITWGDKIAGGDSSTVREQLRDSVRLIFSTHRGFAALKEDGSVATWGGNFHDAPPELQGNVCHIYRGDYSFAAVKRDGSVVTWIDGFYARHGLCHRHDVPQQQLQDGVGVQRIYLTRGAYATLKFDGSVVTWGHASCGGDSSAVCEQLRRHVHHICAGSASFEEGRVGRHLGQSGLAATARQCVGSFKAACVRSAPRATPSRL